MKRFLCFLLTAVMMCTALLIPICSAETKIYYDGAYHTYTGNLFKLKVNGKVLDCSVPPIVFHDYSVVPARDVFEHLGATVLWDGENEKVTVHYDGTRVILYINKTRVYKNNKLETLPIAPKIINGKTMIPVRYVAESLGFDVDFDSKTDTISIVTDGKTVTEPEPQKPVEPEVQAPTYDIKLNSFSHTVEDGSVTVKLNLSKSGATYSSFTLTGPDRIAVDIQNTNMGSGIKNTTVSSDIVTAIRFGLHETGTRVVFDLTGAQTYRVSRSGKVLTVVIGNSTVSGTNTETGTNTDKDTETGTTTTPVAPEIVIKPSRSITIDPGHGGNDPGAIYTEVDEEGQPTGKVWRETDINLAVSLKVRDILKKHGVRVVMTRTTEETVVRRDRPELANEEETALFISIHTNSVDGNPDAKGIETWGSLKLTTDVGGITDKIFAQNVQEAVIDATGAKDRGIKDSETLTVLVYSAMPSILIEVGFITNEAERENMFDDDYRDQLAEGIAEGILKTFEDMGV